MSNGDRSLDTFTISHLGLTASIELSQVDAVPVITIEPDDTVGQVTGLRSNENGPLCRIRINDQKLHGVGPLGNDPYSGREKIEPIMRKALNGRVLWQDMSYSMVHGDLDIDDEQSVTGHGVRVTIYTSLIDAMPVLLVDTNDLEENEHGPICRIFLGDTDLHNNGWDD